MLANALKARLRLARGAIGGVTNAQWAIGWQKALLMELPTFRRYGRSLGLRAAGGGEQKQCDVKEGNAHNTTLEPMTGTHNLSHVGAGFRATSPPLQVGGTLCGHEFGRRRPLSYAAIVEAQA